MIHSQYHKEFESGFAVAWDLVPYSQGCYAGYTDHTREIYYPRLLEPDGRIYLAGEHLSYLTGWQEGAILSAHDTIERLHRDASVKATNLGG